MEDHADPEAILGVTVSFTVLATGFVGARIFTRFRAACYWGLDDLFIVVALLFSIATAATIGLQVTHGLGTNPNLIDYYELSIQMKLFYISIWMYNLSLSCTKISALLQFLHTSPQRAYRMATWVVLGILVAYSVYTLLINVFVCWPISSFWSSLFAEGHCLNRAAIWLSNASINLGTDIIIAVFPLPIIRYLDLPKRQRRALCVVVVLAVFTCVASGLRIAALLGAARAGNGSWNSPMLAIWSIIEINVAISCCCIPTLQRVAVNARSHHATLSGRSSMQLRTRNSEDIGPDLHARPFPSDVANMESRSIRSAHTFARSLSSRQKAHPRHELSTPRSFSGLGSRGPSPVPAGQILVETTVEQEIERRSELGDQDSLHNLDDETRVCDKV